MSYALGIDVGTTFTAAALWRDGRAETVPLGDRANTVPSVLFLRQDGSWLVGEVAERRAVVEPARVAREFKRQLGEQVPVLLGGRPVTPQALAGQMIGWVLARVGEWEGRPPGQVTLTCPANWGAYRRRLLAEAAAAAGLAEVGLVAEPAAAATFYAGHERLARGALVAVYDLGGGTFDAAVLRKTGDGFELVGAPAGDNSLGGIDFDQAVMEHVAGSLGPAWSGVDLADPAVLGAVAQVRANAVAAKEALSSDLDAGIAVILPGVTREVRLTRGELEERIRAPLGRTVKILGQVIASAGVAPGALHSVLLVGGSSRIPLVSELIAAELGVPVAVDEHPKFAVCLGAATLAAHGLRPEPVPLPPPEPLPVPEPAPVPPPVDVPVARTRAVPPLTVAERPTPPPAPAPVAPQPAAAPPPEAAVPVPAPVAPPEPPTPTPRARGPVPMVQPPLPEVAKGREAPRRGRSLLVAVAVVVVALLVGSAIVVAKSRGRPAGTTGTAVATTQPRQSASGGAVLFRDDFSGQSNHWTVGTGPKGWLRYVQGAYQFHPTTPKGMMMGAPTFIPTDAAARLRIEVGGQQLAGATDAGYGVFCRFTGDIQHFDTTSFYELEIHDSGSFAIQKFLLGRWNPLVLNRNPAAIKAGQVNQVRVECAGGQGGQPVTLSLWANGHLLARRVDRSDPLPPGGRVGVLTATYYHAPVDVVFDNFIVYAG